MGGGFNLYTMLAGGTPWDGSVRNRFWLLVFAGLS
jgi:hypothetical protein